MRRRLVVWIDAARQHGFLFRVLSGFRHVIWSPLGHVAFRRDPLNNSYILTAEHFPEVALPVALVAADLFFAILTFAK
jgi:hypothetical protein